MDGRGTVKEILARHVRDAVLVAVGASCIALPVATQGVDWFWGAVCAYGGCLALAGLSGVVLR